MEACLSCTKTEQQAMLSVELGVAIGVPLLSAL
jgi:hypothetical protein